MNEMEARADDIRPYEGNDVKTMTPEQLGGEIRLLTQQARRMALAYAIQIGYRLKMAHEKVGPHGWAEWLARETDFSAAAASRFEKLYEGYGEDQGSLFGVENKFPTLKNISVSNALRLLAVPEEEREQVAREVDAENLSARELERALAERDEARKQAEAAMEERGFWEDKATEKALELDKAKANAERWEEQAGTYASQVNDLQADLLETGRKLKELESRPVEVAVERDEEAIRQAAEEARKAAEDAAKADMDKLRAKLEKAEKAKEKAEAEAKRAGEQRADDIRPYEEKLAKAEEEAEALKKKLLSAESGANVVATLFSLAQQNFSAALDKVAAMKDTHPDAAAKLLAGMEQVMGRLLENVKGARG